MEVTANALQTIQAGGHVIFTETTAKCPCGRITNREDSGLITIRGGASYKVTFGANIALPTGGTPGPISLALAIGGEPLPVSTMIETPAAVEEFSNVSRSINICIPQGCCYTLSVQNTSGVPVDVQNANLIIERS